MTAGTYLRLEFTYQSDGEGKRWDIEGINVCFNGNEVIARINKNIPPTQRQILSSSLVKNESASFKANFGIELTCEQAKAISLSARYFKKSDPSGPFDFPIPFSNTAQFELHKCYYVHVTNKESSLSALCVEKDLITSILECQKRIQAEMQATLQVASQVLHPDAKNSLNSAEQMLNVQIAYRTANLDGLPTAMLVQSYLDANAREVNLRVPIQEALSSGDCNRIMGAFTVYQSSVDEAIATSEAVVHRYLRKTVPLADLLNKST